MVQLGSLRNALNVHVFVVSRTQVAASASVCAPGFAGSSGCSRLVDPEDYGMTIAHWVMQTDTPLPFMDSYGNLLHLKSGCYR